MEQTNSILTNFPNKGLQMDYSEMSNPKDIWTYARNTIIASHNGDLLHLQNEPSNEFCCEFPYTYIGSVKLKDNKYAIFTTNNTDSEIGIFNQDDCSYTTYVNDSCLNFNTSNPIFATAKEGFDSFEDIYFVDGQLNEIRKLSMNPLKIPYTFSVLNDDCLTKVYTTDLDCNELSITKNFTIPCIDVNKSSVGVLSNGSYQFGIAYSVKEQRLTDVFSLTYPYNVWSHRNNAGSLEIKVNNLDNNFSHYQLYVIATIENQTFYKLIGTFLISQVNHILNNINKPEYIDVPLEEITVKKTYYQKADYLTSNDQFLFLSGVSTRPKLNYQKQALKIKSKVEVYQAPLNYYSNYNKVGYYRDEVYTFGIQWLFSDGEWSDIFHIPGRASTGNDLQVINNNDVFDATNCNVSENKRWQVYNTASSIPTPFTELEDCSIKKIGSGSMSYHESTEHYPDNVEMFDTLACNPIRHHKFPDESKVARYSKDTDGRIHINILGVSFYDIENPKDSNGNDIPNIQGYRILRGNRTNNRTVIARGVTTNVRGLTDLETSKVSYYSNYPFNSPLADLFLTQQSTISNPNSNVPPVAIFKDKFTFYAPHCLVDRISLGDYIKFDVAESGTVLQMFEETFKHPKHKLITNAVLVYAITFGLVDGYIRTVIGKKLNLKFKDGTVNATVIQTTPPQTTNSTLLLNNIEANSAANDILQSLDDITKGLPYTDILVDPVQHAIELAQKALLTAAKLGLTALSFTMYAADTAQKVLDIFYNIGPYRQYAIQGNAVATFNTQEVIAEGNQRRKLNNYQYLATGNNTLQDIPSISYNNLYKEDNVYLSLNNDVPLLTGDNSQILKSSTSLKFGQLASVGTLAKVFYSTSKRTLPNQYGSLDSIRYLSTGDCLLEENETVFGGDCYINRFTFNNPADFFTHPLYDQPNGFEYDYRNFSAITYPRYWADFTPYDLTELIPAINPASIGTPNTPSTKHELDGSGGVNFVKNRYFYTSINGVYDIVVESDYNLDNRDWKKASPDFYSQNSNLSKLFENKGENRTYEEFLYDKSYSKQLIEDIFYQQPLDYNPTTDISYYPNMTVYSLPYFKEQKFDNWLNFLSNNKFDFSQSQFGKLTTIKLIDNQELLFLFDKSSPYKTPGRTELKTIDGSTIYAGDGTLIREPRPLFQTDDNFGNCQSRFAFNYTKFGFFYPAQRKGNIFLYSSQLDEISRNGLYYFLNKELPSKLLNKFPNFKDKDNPYVGVGLTSSYDSTYELYYLTKKDYEPNSKYSIEYNEQTNEFTVDGIQIFLSDRKYFNDASWTISYSPSLKFFISFHDYHPVDYITNENHFYSIINKDNKSQIYKHNNTCSSYCNFYGIDYPHAFTLPLNSQGETVIINSIEYQAETFLYKENCRDRNHILNNTYDKALIYNTEQCSGWLLLNIKNKSSMSQQLKYDKKLYNYANNGYDIYVDKVEQKYRFNQFKDIVKDRSSLNELLQTKANGYIFDVNPDAVDFNRSIYESKKIRHTHSKLYLEKTISNDKKHIFYLNNTKTTTSPR